jgi:hypothetical protein
MRPVEVCENIGAATSSNPIITANTVTTFLMKDLPFVKRFGNTRDAPI